MSAVEADYWERKAREHLAEVHALREKCKRLETEQGLHVLRKELAILHRQREADACTIGELALARKQLIEVNAAMARRCHALADATPDPVAFRVFTPEEIAERWRNGLQPKQLSAEEIAALIERIDRR